MYFESYIGPKLWVQDSYINWEEDEGDDEDDGVFFLFFFSPDHVPAIDDGPFYKEVSVFTPVFNALFPSIVPPEVVYIY